MTSERNYVVAGVKPWNKRAFHEVIESFPGNWLFIARRDELTSDFLKGISPRYIFFLHWPWWVPTRIIDVYECVGFHMTDVPYGRGGSPLQNLILRGHKSTKLSAIRMVEELDSGPIYFKRDLSLEGNAEDIYIRATAVSADIIRRIIDEEPQPQPQHGPVTLFERRRPEQSEMPKVNSISEIYDFIRMLDADGYPHAFIEHDGVRYEFTKAGIYDGRIVASVTIRPKEGAG